MNKFIHNVIIEEQILWNISNKSTLIYLIKSTDDGNPIPGNIEGFKAASFYPQLKLVLKNYFRPLKAVLQNLDKNICFLEIDNNYEKLKIECDWCSIINGIIETATENIINNEQLVEKIDFKSLKKMDDYLSFCLIDRTDKITNTQMKEWCIHTFGKITSNLLLFASLYLKTELLELRWCPFKRSSEFYYRNKDNRFLPPSKEVFYEVGKILSQHERITCNNCPKLINDNWKYTTSNTQSIFQPLLDYMMDEIKST